MKRTVTLLFATLAFVLPALAGDPEPPERHEFKVKRGLKLLLDVPSAFDVRLGSSSQAPLTAEIAPKEGRAFEILISAVPIAKKGDPLSTPDEVMAFVRLMGTSLLPTSREKELKLFKLDGENGTGYLYLLTDARDELPPGEFRYMCQGVMLLERVRLSATLLTDSPEQERVVPFFEILRTASTSN